MLWVGVVFLKDGGVWNKVVKNCLDEANLKDHYTSERSCIQCGRFCRGLRWVLLKFGGLCYVCMDGSMDRLIGVDVCLFVCLSVCIDVCMYFCIIYIYCLCMCLYKRSLG